MTDQNPAPRPGQSAYTDADANELVRQQEVFDRMQAARRSAPTVHPRSFPGGLDFDAPAADDPNFGDYNLPQGGNHP